MSAKLREGRSNRAIKSVALRIRQIRKASISCGLLSFLPDSVSANSSTIFPGLYSTYLRTAERWPSMLEPEPPGRGLEMR